METGTWALRGLAGVWGQLVPGCRDDSVDFDFSFVWEQTWFDILLEAVKIHFCIWDSIIREAKTLWSFFDWSYEHGEKTGVVSCLSCSDLTSWKNLCRISQIVPFSSFFLKLGDSFWSHVQLKQAGNFSSECFRVQISHLCSTAVVLGRNLQSWRFLTSLTLTV